MIVRCTHCRTAFSVNDAKIRNKKFSFNCPKCAEENIFDNRLDQVEPDLESLPAGTANDFSDSSYGNERIIDRAPEDRISSRVDSLESSDKNDIGGTTDFEVGTIEGESDSFDDDLNDMLSEKKGPGKKAPDLSLDEIDTNINLDDIDIDISTDAKTGKEVELSFDETDLIQDEMEDDRRKDRNDNILDELSDELNEKNSEEVNIDDVNIDDILIPEDEGIPKDTKRREDRGDILDLEEDLVTLEEVDFESKDEIHHESDIADDSILTDESDLIDKESNATREKNGEDDITLDLDSLDIDLDGDEELLRDVKRGTQKNVTEQQTDKSSIKSTEDDLTLDLNSLDIELSEEELIMEGEHPDDLDLIPPLAEKKTSGADADKEEDLTLDLDSLDITLEETEEFMEGEVLDEDEKLTLQDAGLTIEELTSEESVAALEGHEEDDEEDIKLTLDEIDPNLSGDLSELTTDEIAATVETDEDEEIKLSIDEIDPNLKFEEIGNDIIIDDLPEKASASVSNNDEELIINEIDELPEIDLEDELIVDARPAVAVLPAGTKRSKNQRVFEEELIDIDLNEEDEYSIKYKKDLSDSTVKGSVSLSIDYSIKYSRLGALARLLGLFGIVLIPHFIIFLLYTVLSTILGFLNQIIVLIRRDSIEDFSQIVENTIRYFIAIYSSLVGVVEEFPVFRGKESVDHPLQMKVTYPLHNSKLMALVRISIVGVLLALFPHLLIVGILSLVIPLMYLAGIVAVLINGRWPSMLFDFFSRYYRYCARILCFGTGIVDEYPSFKFE